MAVLQIIAGFLLLGLGGDVLVRGAVAAAERLGVSNLFIGLVLVGFGTSVPEFATSVQAVLSGSPEIAIGNVVGSNIANILLILGVTAVLATVSCARDAFRRDAPLLAATTLVFSAAAAFGTISRPLGAIFLAALIAYVVAAYRSEARAATRGAHIYEREAELVAAPRRSLLRGLGLFVIGVGGVLTGAGLIVAGSVSAARAFNVPEAIIGLTIVAIGTSLPELAASIAAARRRQTDLAYGNIIGSNIFNILGIVGATALVRPIEIPPNVVLYDLWIMCGATALLFAFAFTGARLTTREGAIFLSGYAAYCGFLALRAGLIA